MQFKEVIGQEILKKELSSLLLENRLAHALLFLGKEGTGALPLALAFAQYLVCEKAPHQQAAQNEAAPSLFGDETPAPSEQTQNNSLPESCGTCPACIKAAQLAHPDIHFSYPVITKKSGTAPISTDWINEWRMFIKENPYGNVYEWLQYIDAENKQGNITSTECNDIIRKLNLKSFEGKYKVLILWLPEYLGKEGNRLLKLIEEPPPNTLFILVAENESMILSTILSRCQLVKVPGLENKEIENALIDRENISPLQARQVAGMSHGNYHEALHLVQHSDEDWHSLLRDWLNAILKTGPVAQSKWVDEVSKLGREKQKQFLRYFNHLIQLSVRLQMLGDHGPGMSDLSKQDREFAEKINRVCSLEKLKALVEELDDAAYYIERNANAKMLFMALTIKLYHIIQDNMVLY